MCVERCVWSCGRASCSPCQRPPTHPFVSAALPGRLQGLEDKIVPPNQAQVQLFCVYSAQPSPAQLPQLLQLGPVTRPGRL